MSKNTKKQLLQKLIEKMEEKEKEISVQIERNRQGVIESPGRMQSRYDSMKQELSYLVDSLCKRLGDLKKEILNLKKFSSDEAISNKVELGAVVEVESNKDKKVFFMLPAGAGETVRDKELGEITILNFASPLGKSLFGKVVDEEITVAAKKYLITKIT